MSLGNRDLKSIEKEEDKVKAINYVTQLLNCTKI
jgi:hypothetical protein